MKLNKIFIAITFFSVMLFTQATAADTATAYGINTLPVELKYAGNYKNQPLIQLNFSGTKEESVFSITVTDQTGVVLYSADVRGEKDFTKQFLLNIDDLGDAVLKFEITGKKSGKTAIFQVSRQQKVTEQMDVVKL
ncbi:MAG: hypothetical protein IPP96_06050 [Chitinophagaceae bacterium]|nr:hypothetical protein [Chitinophagaceae bacterium]